MRSPGEFIADATVVSLLVLMMILTGAPTWAWIGFGALAWILLVLLD